MGCAFHALTNNLRHEFDTLMVNQETQYLRSFCHSDESSFQWIINFQPESFNCMILQRNGQLHYDYAR